MGCPTRFTASGSATTSLATACRKPCSRASATLYSRSTSGTTAFYAGQRRSGSLAKAGSSDATGASAGCSSRAPALASGVMRCCLRSRHSTRHVRHDGPNVDLQTAPSLARVNAAPWTRAALHNRAATVYAKRLVTTCSCTLSSVASQTSAVTDQTGKAQQRAAKAQICA